MLKLPSVALEELAGALRAEPRRVTGWRSVLAMANEHLPTPALWSALGSPRDIETVPADVRAYLPALHALNGQRDAVIRQQVLELIAALTTTNIVPQLLKDALTLFDGPYDDPAARMMRDIDVLVPVALAQYSNRCATGPRLQPGAGLWR